MAEGMEDRLAFLGLGAKAREDIAGMHDVTEPHLEGALAQFQASLSGAPGSVRFLFGKDQLEAGRHRDVGQMRAIVAGDVGEAFAGNSARQGLRQARMGLDPRWQIGAYGLVLDTMVRTMMRDVLSEALEPRKGLFGLGAPRDQAAILGETEKATAAFGAILRAVMLDIDLMVSAQMRKVADDARAREDALRDKMRKAAETAGETMRRVAEGEFGARAAAASEPELAPIVEGTNALAERFAAVLEQVEASSLNLRGAAGEIQASAGDLVDRTLRQAVSVDQADAMVMQLAEALSENAKRLVAGSKKAKALVQGAASGSKALRQTGTALEQIAAANAELSGLVQTIDDMAFKANLLALKAAGEAAGAGKAGQGIGAVAVELREMAQGAAEASVRARQLVENHQGRIKAGEHAVGKVGAVLGDLGAQAGESAALFDALAKAGKGQCDALVDVSQVVREMEQMTQHNAVLGEQTNAALEITAAQVTALETIIGIAQMRRPQVSEITLEEEAPLLLERA